ncbi:MAG TPA: ATP-binding protein [Anaerolineaceae bacterium]
MPSYPESPPISSDRSITDGPWQKLADFSLPSTLGSEREAMERVAQIGRESGLKPASLERLKTAVAEAALNAMEHGNHFRAELPVRIVVLRSPTCLRVEISDRGEQAVRFTTDRPGLPVELAGEQSPRGWKLYLIQKMVDQMNLTGGIGGNTIELITFLPRPGEDPSRTKPDSGATRS